MKQDSNKYNVPILEKGMEVLELLAQYYNGLTVQEMHTLLNHSKTSIYRIAITLLETGHLTKDEESNRFLLSRKIFKLGLAALGEADILERAIEPMKRLRDDVKESVMLGTLIGSEVVLLEQVLGAHNFTFMLRPGTHICLHASAPGKVLLAHQQEELKEELISGLKFVKYNENTITSLPKFRKELDDVIRNGYGVDMEEEIYGVYCIGAPVFNQYGEAVASVWTSGPKGRMAQKLFPEVADKVKSCARVISGKLGYKPA